MFDEEPDGDPHGECTLEIKTLQARIAELVTKNERLQGEANASEKLRGQLEALAGRDGLARIAELEAERDAAVALQQGVGEVQDSLLDEIKSLRAERDALKVERDEWAEKWHQMRRQYGEMRWPGMTRVVTASDAAMNQPKESGQ